MRAVAIVPVLVAAASPALAQRNPQGSELGRNPPIVQPERPIEPPGLRGADQPDLSNALPQTPLPPAPPTTPAIAGGVEAPQGFAPWQVQVRFAGELSAPSPGVVPRPEWSRRHLCGGTLIAPDWVLTAAHCLFDHKTEPPRLRSDDEIEVRAGLTDISAPSGAEVRKVKAFVHPGYHPSRGQTPEAPFGIPAENDFALLRLDRPMPLDRPAAIAPLSVTDPVPALKPGDPLILVGWGAVRREEGLMSPVLQLAALKLVDEATCNAVYTTPGEIPVITPALICAAGKTPSGQAIDTCKGDSGGALVAVDEEKFVPVGVSSWGSCGLDRPAVFGDVRLVRDWIADTMNQPVIGP